MLVVPGVPRAGIVPRRMVQRRAYRVLRRVAMSGRPGMAGFGRYGLVVPSAGMRNGVGVGVATTNPGLVALRQQRPSTFHCEV